MQEEPTDSLDQIRLGFFAAIGIQKGKPFAPDPRMKKILTEAAAVGTLPPVPTSSTLVKKRPTTIPKATGKKGSLAATSSNLSPVS